MSRCSLGGIAQVYMWINGVSSYDREYRRGADGAKSIWLDVASVHKDNVDKVMLDLEYASCVIQNGVPRKYARTPKAKV